MGRPDWWADLPPHHFELDRPRSPTSPTQQVSSAKSPRQRQPARAMTPPPGYAVSHAPMIVAPRSFKPPVPEEAKSPPRSRIARQSPAARAGHTHPRQTAMSGRSGRRTRRPAAQSCTSTARTGSGRSARAGCASTASATATTGRSSSASATRMRRPPVARTTCERSLT